ncbi:MAG TPA: hydrogenase maturation protease [Polyangiales bacterium]|nr:hydrogenase maturation protease [Polyangiales bacterium]
MTRPLLIAGIGNLFLGDDAFGCEVARRLCERYPGLRDGVELRDFGNNVRSLGYELAARTEAQSGGSIVIVDAVATGAAPGTVQWFDLATAVARSSRLAAPHAHGLADVLATASELGARLDGTYLLGCQPACFEPKAVLGALTPQVEAAARRCVSLLGALIEDPEPDSVALCLN